ncbi:MAG: hypothetical protein GY850_46350 [bacterium]|nr:hypothetical protein [bacterium]
MSTTHHDLRSKLVIKAARNIQRGYESEESVDGMFRPEIKLDLQRSRYMTESMKQTDGQPTVLRQAKALAHVLDNMDIVIQDWERIVGLQTSDPNGLVHPIELNWKSVLRLVNSDMGKTLLDDEGRRELDELCDYWKDKSMSDRQQEMFGGDLAKYWKYEGTILWSHWTEGGIPDYETLFKTGIKGRIEQVESRLTEIDATIPRDYIEQKEFLTAAVVALKGVLNFAARYARLAREKSEQEIDPERKATLAQIAETCGRVPENPPRTFLEAVQFFYFIHLIRYLEFSTIGIGVRLDIILGTFFEDDLKAGRITRAEAAEILQLLWIKFMELGFVYSPLLTSVYGGVASLQALTIGGTDVDGNDITNDLTYLILETGKTMQSIEPSLVMRVHDGTPDKLFSGAVDVIRTGVGYPSLFNDEALVPLLQKWGAPLEDARNYASSGCVYMDLPAKNMVRRALGYMVLPKILWWAFHRGINPETGEQWGAQTADLSTFKSWQDVFDAYLEQVLFFTRKQAQLENTCRDIYTKYSPRVFLSSVLEGCIESGRECRQWVYPSMINDFIITIGTTNVADSLAAIKKVVFEDKKVTLCELIDIMAHNWEGREDIRQACLNAPKYGNDDDYADPIAREVHHRTEAVIETVKDRFGNSLRGDGSAVSATYGLSVNTPATPDGRKNGGYFSDSTLAPSPGADVNGPTAVLNSCAKIDTLQTYNHLLNQKFTPNLLEGDMKSTFIGYLKTWREMRIPHVQFNIIDRDTLIKAQQEPQNHPDLIVRVAGYSAHFVDLTKGLQDHIIARTEQNFS